MGPLDGKRASAIVEQAIAAEGLLAGAGIVEELLIDRRDTVQDERCHSFAVNRRIDNIGATFNDIHIRSRPSEDVGLEILMIGSHFRRLPDLHI